MSYHNMIIIIECLLLPVNIIESSLLPMNIIVSLLLYINCIEAKINVHCKS